MIRRLVGAALVAACVPVLFFLSARVVDPGGATLDLSLPWSLTEFHTVNAQRFAEHVRAATEDRVKIMIHAGASLGIKGPDGLRAVSDGVVPMAEMAGFMQVGDEPILGLEALPFLVDDFGELKILYEIIRPSVEAAFARRGVKVLYIVPWPNQNIFLRRFEGNLSDLAGLKVRTMDAKTSRLMDEVGLVPVQMPSPDVVPALASGAIDATLTSTTTAVAQKYWDFLSYTVRSNHLWACNMMVINQSVWETLSPEDQQAIETLAKILEPEFWGVAKRDDARMLKILEAQGLETLAMPEAWRTELMAISRDIWRRYVEDTPNARPLMEAYLEATGRDTLADPEEGS